MGWVDTGWEIPNVSDYMVGYGAGLERRGAGVSTSVGRISVTVMEPPNSTGRNREWKRFVGYGTCGGVGFDASASGLDEDYEQQFSIFQNILGNLVGWANNGVPLPGGSTRLFGWDRRLTMADFDIATLISVELAAGAALNGGAARGFLFVNLGNWIQTASTSSIPPRGAVIGGFIKYGMQLSNVPLIAVSVNICGFGGVT